MSTPHPKGYDVETCDRLNMIARTFEVKLQKCIVTHEEITKTILPCMGDFERLGVLKCPIINAVEGSQTHLEYSGWFNKTKRENRMVSKSISSMSVLKTHGGRETLCDGYF